MQTIEHLHVHLIPRYVGDVSNPRGGVTDCNLICDIAETTKMPIESQKLILTRMIK